MRPGGRLLALLACVLLAVLVAPGAQASPRSAPLVVSGLGGQTALLTAPRGGLDVEYPLFGVPRLPGPDGAVGGVVIQRVSDSGLAAGVVLQNVPGFDEANAIPLVGFDHTVLAAGRYRVTLLGTGRQEVHLTLRSTTQARHLAGSGRALPITRTTAGTAPSFDSWSAKLGRTGGSDYLLIGAGGGGDEQQAEQAQMCLQPTSAAADTPCITGAGGGFYSPGLGGSAAWSTSLYPPDSLGRTAYTFSGNAVGVGPSSTTGHAAVVIELRP